MRIGLRRLRAALSLFKPLFSDAQLAPHRQELRWLSAELGLARDYDVFLDAHAGKAATGNEAEQVRSLRAVLVERRQHAFQSAQRVVESERTRAVIEALATWFVSSGWKHATGEPAPPARSARALARSSLERRTKRIRKRARALAMLSPTERHRLRVAVKKLRYGTEFFSSLFAKNERKRKMFTRRLEALQEQLGQLNDLSVQSRLAVELSAGESAEGPLRAATAAPAPTEDAERTGALLAKAARAAQRFQKAGEFWH